MTEEQFNALKDWIEAAAEAAAGRATHQQRSPRNLEQAEEYARIMLVEDSLND